MERLLVESALRALVLGAAVWGALKALRVRDARTELRAWTVVLAAAIAMPFLLEWAAVPVPVPLLAGASRASMEFPAAAAPILGPTEIAIQRAGFDWRATARWVYLFLAAVMLLRLGAGLWKVWRLWAAARPIGPGVRESAVLLAPVTCWSTVLVPASWKCWDGWKQRAVLAHEFSHVKRADFWLQLMAGIYRAIFWFSPLGWLLHKRLSELAEEVSDLDAATELRDNARYAEVLLGFAAAEPLEAPAIPMARPATLGKRVERILESKPATVPVKKVGLAVLIVIAAGACCLLQAQSAGDPPLPPTFPAPASPPDEASAQAPPPPPVPPGPVQPPAPPPPPPARGSGNSSLDIQNGRIRYQRDGKTYIITDPQTVRQAKELASPGTIASMLHQEERFSRAEQTHQAMEQLRKQLKQLAERIQAAAGDDKQIAEHLEQMTLKIAATEKRLAEQDLSLSERQAQLAEKIARVAEAKAHQAQQSAKRLSELLEDAIRKGLAQDQSSKAQ